MQAMMLLVLDHPGSAAAEAQDAPAATAVPASPTGPAPWTTNTPIASVRKQLYLAHSAPRAAAVVSVQYVGLGMEMREWQAVEKVSDVADKQRARWSKDNGVTWSDWVPQSPSSMVDYQGVKASESGWADTFDPGSGLLLQLWLRQIETNRLFHNVTYLRTSKDNGRNWSTPLPFRYEDSPPFDPERPLNGRYLSRSQGYPGNNILIRKDGSLVVCLAHANAPQDPQNELRAWRMGSVLFLGRWDPGASTYRWKRGARVEISPELSARGLMDPEVAELKDGRLLVVWRGSDEAWNGSKAKEPGRKWYSLSEDGGQKLAPIAPWCYSDGEVFYSPSSIHRTIRHSASGKLYWLGNICIAPPQGNHPRYPLLIGEVDESSGRLKRETLSVIADREPTQGAQVQFSNFSLIENRVTHDLEIYLTSYGQEPKAEDWATADCWKYSVTISP